MLAKLKADLVAFTAQIEALNKELDGLEVRKREILKVGTRLEGVISYLAKSIEDLENAHTEPPVK